MRFCGSIAIALLLLGVSAHAATQKDRRECDANSEQAPAPAQADCRLAAEHWQSVEGMNLAAAYQDHLDRFPSYPFATLAKLRIEALRKKP